MNDTEIDPIDMMLNAFSKQYYLDGKEPKQVTTREEMQRVITSFESSDDHIVKVTHLARFYTAKVKRGAGKGSPRPVRIGRGKLSTVFLRYPSGGYAIGSLIRPPLFFETMLFTRTESLILARYETWDEALKAHNKIVALNK